MVIPRLSVGSGYGVTIYIDNRSWMHISQIQLILIYGHSALSRMHIGYQMVLRNYNTFHRSNTNISSAIAASLSNW